MFLIWFDDSKKTAIEKIAAGSAAYRERFGVAPEQVLVNEADLCAVPNIRVESRAHISRSNFWLGPLVEAGRG